MPAKTPRPDYSDNFRADAVVALRAAGWPQTKGALERIAKAKNIPMRTLSRWAKGESNPPPDNVVSEKTDNLIDLIRQEVLEALHALPGKRDKAYYRDLIMSIGILVDKLQLLQGQPTEIISVTADFTSLAQRKGIDPAQALRDYMQVMAGLPDVRVQ